jgi:hypothetical protein
MISGGDRPQNDAVNALRNDGPLDGYFGTRAVEISPIHLKEAIFNKKHEGDSILAELLRAFQRQSSALNRQFCAAGHMPKLCQA